MKIRAMLIQQGLAAGLPAKKNEVKEKGILGEKEQLKKEEMLTKAHCAIILCSETRS